MTVCIGLSLHKRGHQLQSDTPPHMAHPPTCLLSSSFPERCQPSLRPDHQASDLSVIVPFRSLGFCHWLGLSFPVGSPQMVADSSHILIHTFGRGPSCGGLCTPKGGEVKVDRELWPASKQIMWTVPCHGRSGGIVGMHYFSRMSWPVSLFVFSQLPNHSHYGLMWSLHHPIHLWVVGCGLQLLHTEEFTHFVNDAAHEVSTLIAQKPG